jgi:hypothetical protein
MAAGVMKNDQDACARTNLPRTRYHYDRRPLAFPYVLENHMATRKTTKAKPLSKSKRANAPLLAGTASVRRSKARGKATRAPASADALNPAFAMFEFMARVTAAYAELSSRLLQCRSPMDFWHEQARFAQRILNESQSAASTPSPTSESGKRPNRAQLDGK